jgi:hypothetical protein
MKTPTSRILVLGATGRHKMLLRHPFASAYGPASEKAFLRGVVLPAGTPAVIGDKILRWQEKDRKE